MSYRTKPLIKFKIASGTSACTPLIPPSIRNFVNDEENALWRGFEARIERLEHLVEELLDIVNGNRHRKIVGLASEQDRMDLELRKINAVLFQDPTGQKGLLHDVDFLMGRRKYDNQSRELKWKLATEIVIKILALVGILLLGWDKMEGLYKKLLNQKQSPLEERIEQAKHPKGKKIFRIRIVPEKPISDPTKDSNQN